MWSSWVGRKLLQRRWGRPVVERVPVGSASAVQAEERGGGLGVGAVEAVADPMVHRGRVEVAELDVCLRLRDGLVGTVQDAVAVQEATDPVGVGGGDEPATRSKGQRPGPGQEPPPRDHIAHAAHPAPVHGRPASECSAKTPELGISDASDLIIGGVVFGR